jgi:hypothetical protein
MSYETSLNLAKKQYIGAAKKTEHNGTAIFAKLRKDISTYVQPCTPQFF